jgi:hypothetical protein
MWHLVLFIDSEHPSYNWLCKSAKSLLPGPSAVYPRSQPPPRFQCMVWRNVHEENLKPFFFRLLDGNLKSCKRYILELDEAGVKDAVARCLAAGREELENRARNAEAVWMQLTQRQLRELKLD